MINLNKIQSAQIGAATPIAQPAQPLQIEATTSTIILATTIVLSTCGFLARWAFVAITTGLEKRLGEMNEQIRKVSQEANDIRRQYVDKEEFEKATNKLEAQIHTVQTKLEDQMRSSFDRIDAKLDRLLLPPGRQ